ncbi:lipid-A-disaccharide synthase [Pseudidiomarina aestuarii]|uniref:Lipid-A-disaccharide synthase n=1 Tax=Pseudidiomarina aestuarii TaxID=624146 RepID=A0A7Z6ZTR8_9GAMM|nr:lipid-A-disaccharide synthase [Pseudidiomarina aestuarii]RUO41209.1 lipid-A-disaccharide synthase [Pseudidiomarina aestuarii]
MKQTNVDAPVIALLAGEHSGDTLGSDLMRALRQLLPNCQFIGVGGPKMAAQGLTSLVPMEDLAVMGLAEVISSLPQLLRHRRTVVRQILAARPNVFIGIDAPDFNLPIEKKLKAAGIPTVHYVSPSVWAWRQGRIHGIKAATHHVLCLLPFEKAFYDQHQAPATFVGHPLADSLPILDSEVESVAKRQSAARRELGLVEDKRVVGLLPGSRAGEIARLAPIYLRAAALLNERDPTVQFVTPMVSAARREQFYALAKTLAPELPLTIIDGKAHTVIQASDAIIVTSGTVTLEAMLLGTPMVVAYNFSWLSFQLIRRLFKAPFFSLPNLLAQRELVRELVQHDVTPAALVAQVQVLLDQEQTPLRNEFRQLHALIQQNASASGAHVICDIIQKYSK